MKSIKISPSILSSDFANLESESKLLELAGADMLHIDVMDGHFVNNITIGPVVIDSLRKKTQMILDVHLMISEPMKYIDEFVNAGSDIITIHYESNSDIRATLEKIKMLGKKASLAIKPNTPAEVIVPYLDILDMVLVMTVEPGFGGQKFMTDMMQKLRYIDVYCEKIGRVIDIQVDGGINNITADECIKNGANILVSGAYIFKSTDYKKAIDSLRK